MSVEARPLGVKCNLSCEYCYQEPQREAGNVAREYDLSAMQRTLLREGQPFSIFGGEPLLLPLADLEELMAFGLANFGYTAIQTNGSLLEEEHISLFLKYKVHVGVSLDGPGPLNDARRQGTRDTRE